MKKYIWYDESYYERPPCDCCQGSWMEVYNSNDSDTRNGSAFSIEDCYTKSIITEVGWAVIPEDYKDFLYQMSLEELKEEAKNLNIEIEIVS